MAPSIPLDVPVGPQRDGTQRAAVDQDRVLLEEDEAMGADGVEHPHPSGALGACKSTASSGTVR
jgi:hypothetical protein